MIGTIFIRRGRQRLKYIVAKQMNKQSTLITSALSTVAAPILLVKAAISAE